VFQEGTRLFSRTTHVAVVNPSYSVLVPFGSTWQYLEDGSDRGKAWRDTQFEDSSWKAGPGPLGYGNGDEATDVDFGVDSSRKHLTTYLRHSFEVGAIEAIKTLILHVVFDDGVAVYLNGRDVARRNLPQDATASDGALDRIASTSEKNVFTFKVGAARDRQAETPAQFPDHSAEVVATRRKIAFCDTFPEFSFAFSEKVYRCATYSGREQV
jgi:hypothetical protein